MTTPHDDPNAALSAAAREACASLPKEMSPPAILEERVVRALVDRGLIRAGGASPRRPWTVAAGIAAAVVLFAAGVGTGIKMAQPSPPAEAPAGSAPQWVLLLYEDGAYQAAPAGEEAGRVGEYAAWARDLASRGTLISGEKLGETGTILAGDSGRVRVDVGLPVAREGVLTGYFVIRGESLDEAVSLASGCPHLRYGGRISLRKIDPT